MLGRGLVRYVKGKKRPLSKLGQLLKERRDSVDAATRAARAHQAAQRRFNLAREEHEGLNRRHTVELRTRAEQLLEVACAHLDSAAYEAVRDLRLFSATPARTALISRCAAALLSAGLPAPLQAEPADESDEATDPVAGAAPPFPTVKTSKALVRLSDAQVFACLGRRDLRSVVSSMQLERLMELPELVGLIAKLADFPTAEPAAARALGLSAESKPKDKKKKKAEGADSGGAAQQGLKATPSRAGALFKKLRSAGQVVKVTAAATERRGSHDGAVGRSSERRRSSDPAAGGELERQMLAEATGAKVTLADASASTTAAGHLFQWAAKVLSAVCTLLELQAAAQPELDAAAEELEQAEAELGRCAAEADQLRKAQEAAIHAQERHAAELRLQEAAQARMEAQAREQAREQRLRSVAQVAPAPPAAGEESDRVRPFSDPTAALEVDPSAADSWRVDEDEEEEEEDGAGIQVVTANDSAQARKARELAAFQEQSAKREAALRMRIIAEGGSLLAS
jgi:hypothetical protein